MLEHTQMAKEKTTCENSSGSRLRDNISKIFDCFLIVNRPSGFDSDLAIDYKFPSDFDDAEILQQSMLFCFPFQPTTSTMVSFKDRANHFTFILTDIEGKHRFGFCKLASEGVKCYCILSFVPWFEIFYKILNYTQELSSQSNHDALEAMLQNLYEQPVPESKQTVKITTALAFQAPDVNDLPSIPENRNLSEYFAAVNAGFMMDVFASLMYERRVIFTSNSLSILTSCIHSAEALLTPLHWQHIYIPVMPPHLIEYCLAPMPYLVGVHSSLMPKVRDMIAMDDDVIVADIDREEIESIHNDMESIPNDVMSSLKSLLRKQNIAMGTNCSMAFLRTQARLIGGYRNGLKFKSGEAIVFDEDSFIEYYKSNTAKEFARVLVQLQTFKQFVDGRLDMLNAGIGFRDTFENEVNMLDAANVNERDTYKEWLTAAKKGGNKLIMQFQRKAKDNMKVAQQSLRNYMKQQHSPTMRKKSLEESTQRIRPSRPPARPAPINPDKLAEIRALRLKPPRPPPPSLPPNPPIRTRKSFKKARARNTRRYTTLDLGDDSSSVDSSTDLMTKSHLERDRTLSDIPYNSVNVDLLSDIQEVMDEKINNLSSPTKDTNQPDLLLDLSDGTDVVNDTKPSLEALKEERTLRKRNSSDLHRSGHVNQRPTIKFHHAADLSYSSDELSQSPERTLDVADTIETLIDLSVTTAPQKEISAVEPSAHSASQDLLGLDFGVSEPTSSSTSTTSNSEWFVKEKKPPVVPPKPTNPFSHSPDTASSQQAPPNYFTDALPAQKPHKLSPDKFNPFKVTTNTNSSSSVLNVGTPTTSYFSDSQSLSEPTSNTLGTGGHVPPILSPTISSLSGAGAVRNNPFMNSSSSRFTQSLRHNTNPFKSTDSTKNHLWKNPNTAKSLGNGGFVRGGSLKQPPTSNDNELFSDLLGSWKSREGL